MVWVASSVYACDWQIDHKQLLPAPPHHPHAWFVPVDLLETSRDRLKCFGNKYKSTGKANREGLKGFKVRNMGYKTWARTQACFLFSSIHQAQTVSSEFLVRSCVRSCVHVSLWKGETPPFPSLFCGQLYLVWWRGPPAPKGSQFHFSWGHSIWK